MGAQTPVELQVAVEFDGNPNNPSPGEPTTPLGVELWEAAQIQSEAYSDQTDFAYQQYLEKYSVPILPSGSAVVFPLGAGSVGPGTFFSNGNPPNEGNQP